MRIAIFSETYYPEINGIATSIYNLKTALEMHGHKVLLVTTNPFTNKLTYEDGIIRLPGIRLKFLYNYRMSRFYNAEAAEIIKEFKPDVVHVQTSAGVGHFGSKMGDKLGIGKVYTFHTMIEDYAFYLTHGHFDHFARYAIRKFFRGKSTHFDEFIAPSAKIKEYLRSIGVDTTVSVIPTGIDIDRYSAENIDTSSINELKAELGIDPNDFVVLYLGRIAKEKSIDFLLSGFAAFAKKHQDVNAKFLITGWGPAESDLKALAAKYKIADKTIFAGKCDPTQTQKYYHLADCFVSASLTETQGLTLIEALASSIPCIARFDEALVDTIRNRESGFLFLDEPGFVQCLEDVMNLNQEERARIVDAGRKAIEGFSLELFYQNIIEVYKRVERRNW